MEAWQCVNPGSDGCGPKLHGSQYHPCEGRKHALPHVLVRLRTKCAAWTTDVSKLYNMLHLTDSALLFPLFLFDPSLDSARTPKVWVMQRAWYGVTSTGNQSGVALEELASKLSESHPRAQEPLMADRYVDDIASGADSSEELE